MSKKIVSFLLAGVAVMSLSSCDGIFSDIYDNPQQTDVPEYGFIAPATQTVPGTIYIDATSYTDWVYIDFSTMTAETFPVEAPAPATWDIAVHRYDAKTDGATVSATASGDFTTLTPAETPVADEWTTQTIVTDMSTMMDGYLSYAESSYNRELSRWLDVDKSTMPPIYTMSGKVYLVNLRDGRRVALRLDNYMDGSGIKGYLTIRYMIAD